MVPVTQKTKAPEMQRLVKKPSTVPGAAAARRARWGPPALGQHLLSLLQPPPPPKHDQWSGHVRGLAWPG